MADKHDAASPTYLALDDLSAVSGGTSIHDWDLWRAVSQGNVGNCGVCATTNAILGASDNTYRSYFDSRVVPGADPGTFDVTLRPAIGAPSVERTLGAVETIRVDPALSGDHSLRGWVGNTDARGGAFVDAFAVGNAKGTFPAWAGYEPNQPFPESPFKEHRSVAPATVFESLDMRTATTSPATAAAVSREFGTPAVLVTKEHAPSPWVPNHAYSVGAPDRYGHITVENPHHPRVPQTVYESDLKHFGYGVVGDLEVQGPPRPPTPTAPTANVAEAIPHVAAPPAMVDDVPHLRATGFADAMPAVRTAGGVAGVGGIAVVGATALSDAGYLPAGVGEVLRPAADVIGNAYEVFSPTKGALGDAVMQNSPTADRAHEFVANFAGDSAVFGGAYHAAGALFGRAAGPIGAAAAGAYAGLNHFVYDSDYAKARGDAVAGVGSLGLDVSAGSFGRDLANSIPGDTSGFLPNRPETQQAVAQFQQLYWADQAQHVNLDPNTIDGRDRLSELRSDASAFARAGGDPYANAVTNEYDSAPRASNGIGFADYAAPSQAPYASETSTYDPYEGYGSQSQSLGDIPQDDFLNESYY